MSFIYNTITNVVDIPNDLFEHILSFLPLQTVAMMLTVNTHFQFIQKSNNLLKYFMNLSVYQKPEKNKYIYFVMNTLRVIDVKPISQPIVLNHGTFVMSDTEYIFYCWREHLCNNKIVDPDRFRELYTQLNLYEASIKQFSINYNGWKIFNKTSIWNSLSRIVSYTSWNNFSISSLNNKLFKPRELNINEQKVFNIVRINKYKNTFNCTIFKKNIYNKRSELVMNFGNFIKNFNSFYWFSCWKHLINWNNFCIAGGSILAALLNKDWTNETSHDVDLFAYEITHYEFCQQIQNILSKLDSNNCTFTNTFNVKTLKLSVYVNQHHVHLNQSRRVYETITIQFIFVACSITPNIILHNFDLEIVQTMFQPNINTVFATDAFIQSLNTNTFIPYNLINHDKILSIKTIGRIKKYINRGFNQILIPKSMPIDVLSNALNQTDKIIIPRLRGYLIINADNFEVQKKMIKEILS